MINLTHGDTEMTTKNGFEIRLELLRLAKEIADQQYKTSSDAYWNMLTDTSKTWNMSTEKFVEKMKEASIMPPAIYSPADVIAKAQEMYNFVTKKD